jgi:hypothetical protein
MVGIPEFVRYVYLLSSGWCYLFFRLFINLRFIQRNFQYLRLCTVKCRYDMP